MASNKKFITLDGLSSTGVATFTANVEVGTNTFFVDVASNTVFGNSADFANNVSADSFQGKINGFSFPTDPAPDEGYSLATLAGGSSGEFEWKLLERGDTGFAGSRGLTGSRGQAGDNGFTGSVGPIGPIGLTGSRGVVGSTGFTGSIGGLGFTGSQGAGFTGSRGVQGDQGPIGFTGSRGVQGIQGVQGLTGLTGSRGFQGFDGATGLTGSRGFAGANGFNGSRGFTGSAGPGADQALNTNSNVQFASVLATGNITAFSDKRLKENITQITEAVNKVKDLRGVYYNRTDIDNSVRYVGVIAQEILEVLPEVVQKSNGDYYSVAYGNIVALLIEAMKELVERVESLENK